MFEVVDQLRLGFAHHSRRISEEIGLVIVAIRDGNAGRSGWMWIGYVEEIDWVRRRWGASRRRKWVVVQDEGGRGPRGS